MMAAAQLVILFLMFVTGFVVICAGLLYVSVMMFGNILKYLGWWKIIIQAIARIYQERRDRR